MKNLEFISQLLNANRPSLSDTQKAALWKQIELKTISQKPIPSPFLFSFVSTRSMVSAVLLLVVVLGLGGTAIASESARPGDLLFPIDRTIEKVRLSFTSADDQMRLKESFAEERIQELQSILNDESIAEVDSSDTEETFTGATGTKSIPPGIRKTRSENAVDTVVSFLSDADFDEATRNRFLNKVLGELDSVSFTNKNSKERLKIKGDDIRLKIRTNTTLDFDEETEGDKDESSYDEKNDNESSDAETFAPEKNIDTSRDTDDDTVIENEDGNEDNEVEHSFSSEENLNAIKIEKVEDRVYNSTNREGSDHKKEIGED